MNNNETLVVRQPITALTNEKLKLNLRQAINIINADYKKIDWEDQAFLNHVLIDALSNFETKGGDYANS